MSRMSALVANVRDASFIACPRHDGPGGHRPGAWGPKYHVKIDHPTKGGSWSACGKTFLIAGGDEGAADIPHYQRCRLNGCRQMFEEADRVVVDTGQVHPLRVVWGDESA